MIHGSVASCVGRTPLVQLARAFPADGLEVIAKLELLNPGGSVKARSARYIIEQGMLDGPSPRVAISWRAVQAISALLWR